MLDYQVRDCLPACLDVSTIIICSSFRNNTRQKNHDALVEDTRCLVCNDNELNDTYIMANSSLTGAGAGTSTVTGSIYTAHITHTCLRKGAEDTVYTISTL